MQGVTAAQARAAQGLTSWNEARYTAGFNENDLGLLLALSIPMSLYLLVRRQRRSVALLCWAQIAVAVTAILLTGSRGGLVSLLVALTMLPLALSGMSGLERGLSIAAVIAALAGGIYILPAETWERLMSIRTALFEGTLTHRTSIWAAGVEVFRQHPFLGVGAGAFGPSVLSLLDIPYVAHNSFLSVAVELGVIGAVIGVVLLASFYGAALRLPGLERRLWIVLLLTWTVGVSSLTWEYRKPTWFLFGLLAAQAAISRPRRAAPRAAVSRPFAEAYS
jgi:O-antigen ligase